MMGAMWRALAFLFIFLMAGPAGAVGEAILLADPAVPLAEAWQHRTFGPPTAYERVEVDGRKAIRARGGARSASGLYRRVAYSVGDHPWLEWSWRVERLQETADIRVKEGQDFAAALYLIFGEPSLTNRDVPVLVYAWTNGRVPAGTVVRCPHHPETMRHLVVESGSTRLGRWIAERRNVAADFRRAFGSEAPTRVDLIALFTDNDQTGEPVEALYGAVRALK